MGLQILAKQVIRGKYIRMNCDKFYTCNIYIYIIFYTKYWDNVHFIYLFHIADFIWA